MRRFHASGLLTFFLALVPSTPMQAQEVGSNAVGPDLSASSHGAWIFDQRETRPCTVPIPTQVPGLDPNGPVHGIIMRELGAGSQAVPLPKWISILRGSPDVQSGATTITAGTLQIGNGGTMGSLGSGNVTNCGTLT